MSIVTQIPSGTFFRPCAAIYTATFNAPTIGKYDFGIPANQNVAFLDLNPSNIYLLSNLSFSANIDVSAYLENIETIPTLDLFLKKQSIQLFGQGYPLVTYLAQNEIATFFWTDQEGDQLVGTFGGLLGQNASLATVASVTSQVSLGVYEIIDAAYIAKIKGLASQGPSDSIRNNLQVPKQFVDRI